MATDRDILDQIDDVITWDGSRDAMVWTAEPSMPPALPAPNIDPDAAQQLVVQLGAQVQAFAEAFRPFAEILRDVGAMCLAFAEIANTPQMRELAEAERFQRQAMKRKYARRRRGRRQR